MTPRIVVSEVYFSYNTTTLYYKKLLLNLATSSCDNTKEDHLIKEQSMLGHNSWQGRLPSSIVASIYVYCT